MNPTRIITETIPIKTISIANARLNRFAQARMARDQRAKACHALAGINPPAGPPMAIRLTRIAPGRLDSDNLASAFKAVRDGVADWLGIDDGHPGLDWQYAQRAAGPGFYAVEVEVVA